MRFRPLLLWGAVVGVLALVLLLAGADPTRAGTFSPQIQITVDTPTPETASDVTLDFVLPEGDVNFAGVVSFIPREWGIVRGSALPVGIKVGDLTSDAVLGLINGACNTTIPVAFEMQNGSLDREDTVSYDDVDENATRDFAEDKDGNGVFDGIDKYPEFLNRLFPDLDPIRRAAGVTIVAGIPVLLQFLVFPPGTLVNENIPNDEELGYPSVTALQNAGDPDVIPQPGPITDFCTPLTAKNVAFGQTEDGKQSSVTPQDGTYTFTTIARGLRDADNDGFENSFDTCPYDVNQGNPRIPEDGDKDVDGLDAACDPNDNDVNSDQDLDGYLNRQDNCPLEPNGTDLTNQNDNDLDQIGDVCDRNPDTPDGELHPAEPEVEVTIGSGTGPPGPPTNCPDCFVLGEEPGEEEGVPAVEEEDGGLSTGALIAIIVGVAAAVIVIGGGAALMMRRGR